MFPLLRFACMLAALFPALLKAHGTEFIMTRMRLLEDDSLVELRMVVDYAGNPLIADEAAAHEALQHALLIKHGDKITRFTELAPLEFHYGDTWEEAVPASLLPPPDGQEHSLLTGVWRWRPDSAEIAFTVAKGNKHDVLIWRQPPGGETKSVLLLGGDVSPAVAVKPAMPAWCSWGWMALSGAAAGVSALLWKSRHARRRGTMNA
ncbi:MAG: hypothetical protein V4662_02720 [Verrucomicrobiota bacterium]